MYFTFPLNAFVVIRFSRCRYFFSPLARKSTQHFASSCDTHFDTLHLQLVLFVSASRRNRRCHRRCTLILSIMSSSTRVTRRGTHRSYSGSSSGSINCSENLPPRTLQRVAREVRDLHKGPPEGIRLVVDADTGVPSNLGEVLVRELFIVIVCSPIVKHMSRFSIFIHIFAYEDVFLECNGSPNCYCKCLCLL